jgi:PKD repeat protein
MRTLSKALLAGLFALLYLQGWSQCESDLRHNQLYQNNAAYRAAVDAFELAVVNADFSDAERSETTYTIPVVVHVIHTGEPYGQGSNITDEQIYSAITALNDDFRKRVGTFGFGAGVDVNMEFCLASRNPSGQPTTGIVRVNGSSVPLYATEGIRGGVSGGADEAAVKALSTWPRASYVNIWVVNEIGNNNGGAGTQGYAYFPWNSPLDGIVILYNAIGTVGNLKSYTNMNRVLTHEMGHVFSLYHTFNETNSCTSETNCTTQGDMVCDTPPTILNANCSSPACTGTQQVENYMDYTSQTCQNMFSNGQRSRMRTSLETNRASLISSLGCMPVFTTDAGINAIIQPSGISCATAYQPLVTLVNYGSNALTSCTINYNINGVGLQSFPWTGNLAAGVSVPVTLPTISAPIGDHTFYAWASNPNGTADQNGSNNQSTGTFTVANGATLTLTVILDVYGSENTWQVLNSAGNIVESGGPYQDGQQGAVITESICLPTGCYTLNFLDSYGDGQGFTNGSYTLRDQNNAILATANGNWGNLSSTAFCVTASAPTGLAPVANFTSSDNVFCAGGTITFTNTSSNAPTSYSWSFPGGTPSSSASANPGTITYANPGSYNVSLTVTNANGSNTYACPSCVTVVGGPSVTLNPVHPFCNGASNGSVVSNVSGGYAPYTYLWNTGATTASVTSRPAGTYSVTVTNSEGCSATASATLTNPSVISISGTVNGPLCSGSANGSITVTATGGTGTKTFNWNTTAMGSTLSNVGPGTYTVMATDANGCTATQSFTISAPSALTMSGIVTPPTCAASNNGSIAISSAGGTGPRSVSWNTGATGATLNGLGPGSYAATVTDANGCSVGQTFTITAPSVVALSGNVTQPLCAGGTGGSITINATGGTGNKSIAWSNGQSGNTISNIASGTYTATATDANGCAASQSFTIAAPTAITLSAVVTNATCAGGSNGTIVVSASGGTGNKTFTWSNGASGSTASGLATGSYTVTATDVNGCTAMQTYGISSPSAISLNLLDFDASCGAPAGSAQVAPTGGTFPYTVVWSNGSAGNNAPALIPGNYTVTVTDANQCTATSVFTIGQTFGLSVQALTQNITCAGLQNGTVQALVSGGSVPYTYSWSNGATSSSIGALTTGNYVVTVSDANGCSGTAQAQVTAPSALTVSVVKSDVTCYGFADGMAVASALGGTQPIGYVWNTGATTASITELSEDFYSVTAADANGCAANASVSIMEPSILTANIVLVAPETCAGNNGAAEVFVDGGTPGYAVQWSNGQTGVSSDGLSSGNYLITIADANGCGLSSEMYIPYECTIALPTTRLIDDWCGASDVALNAVLVCNDVPEANAYQWKFANIAGQIIGDGITTGPHFFVNDIPQIDFGQVIHVSVKVRVDGVWGDFGQVCTIATPPGLGVTQLIDTDCGATLTEWDYQLTADIISGALNYEWHITGVGYEWTTFTNEHFLPLTEAMQFEAGATYFVKVRCALGNGEFTEWGDLCAITFDASLFIEQSEGTIGLNIWPNPVGNQELFVSLRNPSGSASVQRIEIYDLAGSLVESIMLNQSALQTIHFAFGRPLAQGMYVLRVVYNDTPLEKKFIVR